MADKFLTEYNNYTPQDDGPFLSKDFRSFARKFKNYLKRNISSDAEIKKHSCGHYFLSGFVFKNGKYVYYNYTWNRFDPINVYLRDWWGPNSVLVRTAKSDSDYTGGMNEFCSIADLPEKINEMLS